MGFVAEPFSQHSHPNGLKATVAMRFTPQENAINYAEKTPCSGLAAVETDRTVAPRQSDHVWSGPVGTFWLLRTEILQKSPLSFALLPFKLNAASSSLGSQLTFAAAADRRSGVIGVVGP